jgi:hypothetical protein
MRLELVDKVGVVRGSAVFDGDAVGKIEGIVSVKGWAKLSAWPPVNG